MIDRLKLALVQTELYWENPTANRAMLEEKIWQIEEEVDLIILPEMFTTGFSMNPEKYAEVAGTDTFKWMLQLASQRKATLMGSVMVKDKGTFVNRLYVVNADGTASFYDKRHLFSLAGEDKDYTPGASKIIVEVKGWKIMPLICYDLRFPVWSRSQTTADKLYEYDAVVYVANWPSPRINAWDTLLQARAIENIAYSVGVNRFGSDESGHSYPGHSAVYDYAGQKRAYSKLSEIILTELFEEELLQFRERFPFQRDADHFSIK